MKIIYKTLDELQYKKTSYAPSLKESIERIGLNFPIHLELQNNILCCIDGHKRLSAIYDILKEQPHHVKLQQIPCIYHNARSAAPDCLRNHH